MNKEARVGLMFTLAVGIIGVTLYYMGSFREQMTYRIRFEKVGGLAPDSPVQFNGVPIGRVTQIELADDFEEDGRVPIIVTVSVHRSARKYIRTSTEADIRSVGILGDKMILLLTEDYTAPELEEDGMIASAQKALDMDKLLEQGTDIVADATSISNNLKELLNRLANDDGPIQALWTDQKLAEDMRGSVAALQELVQNDDGLLAVLMKDPEFAQTIKGRVESISADLEVFGDSLRDGDGLLPMLLEDEAFKTEVKTSITELLASSNRLVTEMAESRGLLYTLTRDEAYGARVSANLEKASYHLASILEKIDEGDGTASLLINDPSLYQGVYEVVYGLQHSGIAKWYIRRKQRQGERLLDKDEQDETN